MLVFLKRNTREALILSIKEEHLPKATTRSFSQTLQSYIDQNPLAWYTKDAIPQLKTARGKTILLTGVSPPPNRCVYLPLIGNMMVFTREPTSLFRIDLRFLMPSRNGKSSQEFYNNLSKMNPSIAFIYTLPVVTPKTALACLTLLR